MARKHPINSDGLCLGALLGHAFLDVSGTPNCYSPCETRNQTTGFIGGELSLLQLFDYTCTYAAARLRSGVLSMFSTVP